MAMQVTIPSDMEALVEKRLATGDFKNAEDVVCRALEVLDEAESCTEEERSALDEKIDGALHQVVTGRAHAPELLLRSWPR